MKWFNVNSQVFLLLNSYCLIVYDNNNIYLLLYIFKEQHDQFSFWFFQKMSTSSSSQYLFFVESLWISNINWVPHFISLMIMFYKILIRVIINIRIHHYLLCFPLTMVFYFLLFPVICLNHLHYYSK